MIQICCNLVATVADNDDSFVAVELFGQLQNIPEQRLAVERIENFRFSRILHALALSGSHDDGGEVLHRISYVVRKRVNRLSYATEWKASIE